jgi:predicted dehydrogenase
VGVPHRIGIVGLGNISRAYIDTLTAAPSVRITAVADLHRARAEAVAAELSGARAMDVDELLGSPEVDTVLNLTIPAAHAEIALAAIARGKQVYGEKPLASTFAAARAVVDAADAAGIRLGCAPDTVLGTGTQTARAAIDAGAIGRTLAATAVMVTPGHERWHPNPDFYYREGGGPLLDMGPYYVTALIHLLGPVRSVIGAASRLRTERVIAQGARAGERISVEVDTHVSGILEHASGVLSTLTTSFDGTATTAAPIEVHGERGTLAVPDPNHFDGDVRLSALDAPLEWQLLDGSAGYAGAARGVGLLDFVRADARRPARAGADVALHGLEVMTALLDSAAAGRRMQLTTSVERPVALPLTRAEVWSA